MNSSITATATIPDAARSAIAQLSDPCESARWGDEQPAAQTLAEQVHSEGPLSPREAISNTLAVAREMAAAPKQGVRHRDINPSNILIEHAGGVKVHDCDWAGLKSGDYLAPEQVANPATADHRASIYSLGCTFYFMLTGQTPIPGEAFAHDAPPISRLAKLPHGRAIDQLLQRMLAKMPAQRLQSMREVIEELELCLERLRKRQKARRRLWLGGAGFLGVFLTLSLLGQWLKSNTLEAQVDAAFARMEALNPGYDRSRTLIKFDGPSVKVDFSRDPAVVNLDPLISLPIVDLNCEATSIKDLNAIGRMGSLRRLLCGETTIRDLAPLRGKDFDVLYFTGTQVTDLSPLAGSQILELGIAEGVADLAPLAGMPIQVLLCEGARDITDLTPLQDSPLTDLWMRKLSKIEDIRPLGKLPLLHLRIDFEEARDATVLRTIPSLTTINCQPASMFLAKANLSERCLAQQW